MAKRRFIDRREAGRELALKLRQRVDDAVVYALPRGGVVTAVEISNELETPLDLIITRKIGHPTYAEYAIGGVTETGPAIWNEAEKAVLDRTWLTQAEAVERLEARRRREKYLAGRQPVTAADKIAIVADDGIATGLTMQAAISELKKQKPSKIIVAVPVAPQDTIDALLDEVDEVVVLVDPDEFLGSVGAHYENFPQLSDSDVISLLDEASQ